MIQALGYILFMALSYVAGYLLGMCIAEWIHIHFRERIFSHV